MNKKQRLKQIKEIKDFNTQWISSFMPLLEIPETPILNLLTKGKTDPRLINKVDAYKTRYGTIKPIKRRIK